MEIKDFIDHHYKHFNAGVLAECCKSLGDFLHNDGRMMITLAGAMSTAEIGRSLAPAIRSQKIHAICCTGANLEEDLFNLIAQSSYEKIKDWRSWTAEQNKELQKKGFNRVTDIAIPEQEAIRVIEKSLVKLWKDADAAGDRRFPHEYLYDLLLHGNLEYDADPDNSWLLAAADANLPIFAPGWEDSTLGNILTAKVIDCTISSPDIVLSGLHAMQALADWYREDDSPTGLLQIGGGIAGDFAICVVPMLRQDIGIDVDLWAWFAQISESSTSYGGYSGAPPNEKISWGKLDVSTPKFIIESDATIVLPLILASLE